MPDPTVTPDALAAALAARIIHDLSGPASGVNSGMELYEDADAQDLKEEGLGLAASSGEALGDLLAFSRAAFAGTGEARNGDALAKLVATQFAGKRAKAVWESGEVVLSGPAVQALLILAQIAVGGLPMGGSALITTKAGVGEMIIRVAGEGPRTTPHPEALEGLAGRALSAGLAGRWAPAYFLHTLVEGLGGSVSSVTETGAFVLEARLPA
jgi:histidine phosphotransferase ChpT